MTQQDGYYTPKEVVERLRVGDGTLRRWRSEGKGPPFVKIGDGQSGRVRYPIKEFHEWERLCFKRSAGG